MRPGTGISRKSGNRFSVRECVQGPAFPGKAATGFPSGKRETSENLPGVAMQWNVTPGHRRKRIHAD